MYYVKLTDILITICRNIIFRKILKAYRGSSFSEQLISFSKLFQLEVFMSSIVLKDCPVDTRRHVSTGTMPSNLIGFSRSDFLLNIWQTTFNLFKSYSV